MVEASMTTTPRPPTPEATPNLPVNEEEEEEEEEEESDDIDDMIWSMVDQPDSPVWVHRYRRKYPFVIGCTVISRSKSTADCTQLHTCITRTYIPDYD